MDDESAKSAPETPPTDSGFVPADAPGGFRDVTAADVSTDDQGRKKVSPDYQVAKSNRMSFSIVGVFTAIVVLAFVAMIISFAMH